MTLRFTIAILCTLLMSPLAHAESSVSDFSDTIVSEEDAQAKPSEKQIESSKEDKPDPKAYRPPEGTVPQSLMLLGQGDYFSEHAFLLDKANRTLMVWKQVDGMMKLVEAFPSDMGRKEGDKQVLGDLKTPEGIYFFQEMYQGPRLNYDEYGSRAFTTNYPNLFDRLDNKTGSGIWLHGIPDSKSLWRGSRGCVVVRDEIIKKVGQFISLEKTPIIVQDKVNYVKVHEHQKTLKEWITWLNRWKASWESKDIGKYITFYSEDFETMSMNRDQWRTYKKNLNRRYEYIRVKIQEPTVYIHDNEAIVRFVQVYESDKINDFGEKVLHLKKGKDGKFAIISEDWTAVSGELLAQKQKVITATQ